MRRFSFRHAAAPRLSALGLLLALLLQACAIPGPAELRRKTAQTPEIAYASPAPEEAASPPPSPGTPEGLAVYLPRELAGSDFSDPASRWCWARSRASEHFIVFWEAGFGADPSSGKLSEAMRVDVDGLLDRAETCRRTNLERLGFAAGGEASRLDTYRMMIFLFFESEWRAEGAGYDDTVGALWVNPEACRDGATLAHEIGHCFQYQVLCDQLLRGEAVSADGSGFRYACGGGFGNTFWEQTAQFQAYRDFPEAAFPWYDRDVWLTGSGRALEHEWTRYQSCWFLYALTALYGEDAPGRLWRESRAPEDALGACLRVFCSGDMEQLGEDLWFYASRAATFDFDGAREYAGDWIGGYETALYDAGGALRISYADAPEQGGFNVISVTPDEVGGTVTAALTELPGSPAPAQGDPAAYRVGPEGETPGGTAVTFAPAENAPASRHRYGFVALCAGGRRVYGESAAGDGAVSFPVPEDAEAVYLVVAAVGETIAPHVWDEDESTDGKMPYELVFTGCTA